MRPVLFVLLGLFVTSCTGNGNWSRSPQPAVLVLMVENLGFTSFSCGDSSNSPEEVLFESFCTESVRFTHAYTPSTMSQAAIASLLTGLYPREHGVRHNGPQFLNFKQVTVAEAAKQSGYKTSFISGGPPIWRRSGFNQGFDLFDDAIGLTYKNLYRPSINVINLFLSWQKTEAPSGKFASFLFFADPQFVDQPTVDDLGEVRENSYESQLEEVSESIETLVREMKRRKIWDSTTVVLVGLNGNVSDARNGEPGAVNLYSESTRSTLMVKPARHANPDYIIPSNWKIDSNVSLVDIGETLLEMLTAATPDESGGQGRVVSKMGTVSLQNAFTDPKPNWPDNREILVESAWPDWRGVGGVRASLRRGPYLYLFDSDARLYNTLTDNLEVRPLPLNEPGVARLREEFSVHLKSLGYSPWKITNDSELDRTLLGEDLWRERPVTAEMAKRLKALTRRYPDNRELIGWRAHVDVQRADWPDLKAAAGEVRPLWSYVADVNLNSPKQTILDACSKALFTQSADRDKDCGDDLARALATWADEHKSRADRERAMELFNRLEINKAVSDRVSRANLTAGDTWDVSRGRWSEPSLTELMLATPALRKYRSRKNDRL